MSGLRDLAAPLEKTFDLREFSGGVKATVTSRNVGPAAGFVQASAAVG